MSITTSITTAASTNAAAAEAMAATKNAAARRRARRRRLSRSEVVYRTASGATLIAAAPSGRPVRRFPASVRRRAA
jgi:septal ring factor EnvC (AmiA/AmiB activator)